MGLQDSFQKESNEFPFMAENDFAKPMANDGMANAAKMPVEFWVNGNGRFRVNHEMEHG